MAADTGVSVAHVSKTGAAAPTAVRNGANPPELCDLLRAMEAVRSGDFSARLAQGNDGPLGRIAILFNDIVAANETMARQLERIGKAVGEQGRTRQRVKFANSTGAWGEMETSVN